MNTFLEEITRGLPDWDGTERLIIRLLTAMLLGALIGYEREHSRKAAGLRTHMLVAMGCALFVLGCNAAEMSLDGLSRVIQGVATGIGFIGAGAILKLPAAREIKGLTTAAGLWMTSAVGVVVGLGQIGLAIVAAILTWIVLAVVKYFESTAAKKYAADEERS